MDTTSFLHRIAWLAIASIAQLGVAQAQGPYNCSPATMDGGHGCPSSYACWYPGGGVTISHGQVAFADSVLAYDNLGASIIPEFSDPCRATGIPDYSQVPGSGHSANGTTGAVSLGEGGRLELAFTNNVLTNSGTSAPDLFIFQGGNNVERAFLALRPADAQTTSTLSTLGVPQSGGYFELSITYPTTFVAAIDIDAAIPGLSACALRFDAVRITDDPAQVFPTPNNPGVDIDAVAGIDSGAVQVPQSFTWFDWTFPTGGTAQCVVGPLGLVSVAVTGATGGGTDMRGTPTSFQNVGFAPTSAPSALAGNYTTQAWQFTLDFPAQLATAGVVLGLGNFGHGSPSLPGYSLMALDHNGSPIQPQAFTVLGAFDHTWPAFGTTLYNDDVVLAPIAGTFDVTVTPGGDSYNSDIILLVLPSGLAQLTVSSIAATGGDSVAILLGLPAPGASYCHGDGSTTACPCGNASGAGAHEGCLNSLGLGGTLTATGIASISTDSLTLQGSQMPNSSALFFQGTAQTVSVFGDGLRCAGGTVIRLGTKVNASGSSFYPVGTDPSVSVRGAISAPCSRTYQVWYRNAASFCTPSTFNLTNAQSLTWVP